MIISLIVLSCLVLPLVLSISQSDVIAIITNGICNVSSDEELCVTCKNIVNCTDQFKVYSINEFYWEFTYIPKEIGVLTSLQVLDLSFKRVNGFIKLKGPIPTEIGQLTRLNVLSLAVNQIDGPIPTEIGQLTRLYKLDLSENKLNGSIPTEIGQLKGLNELDLSQNQLNGSIPTEIGQLTRLYKLEFPFNQLNGSIPTEIGQLTKLNQLNLVLNQLNGPIPTEIGQLTELIGFLLTKNQLSGSIPTEIGLLTKLIALGLAMNELNGSIPTEIGQLTGLSGLYLSQNQLKGPIPTEIGQLRNLFNLQLFNNQLNGSIPTEIGQLVSMSELDLSRNQLNGILPTEIGNLSQLRLLFLSDNEFSYHFQLSDLSSVIEIDLSYNNLTSVQIFNIHSLKSLNIRANRLTSSIINNCDSLSILDASYNNLISFPSFIFDDSGLPLLSVVNLNGNFINQSFEELPYFGPNIISLDLSSNNILSPNSNAMNEKEVSLRFRTNITVQRMNCSCDFQKTRLVKLDQNLLASSSYRIREYLNVSFECSTYHKKCKCYDGDTRVYDSNVFECSFYSKLNYDTKPQQNDCRDDQYLSHFKYCYSCYTQNWSFVLKDKPTFIDEWNSVLIDIKTNDFSIQNLSNYYCSRCEDGTLSLERKVIPECFKKNIKSIEDPINCSYPCQVTLEEDHDSKKTISNLLYQLSKPSYNNSIHFNSTTMIKEIFQKRFHLEVEIEENITETSNWFSKYILQLRSYSFDIGFSLHHNNNNLQEEIVEDMKKLVQTIVFTISGNIQFLYNIEVKLVIDGDKRIMRTTLSDKLSTTALIIIVSISSTLLIIILTTICLLYYKGYLNWIGYYFTKEISSLPEEISWPVIHKLKYPYRWNYAGNSKIGFFSCNFKKNSEEWNRVESLFKEFHCDDRFINIDIESIIGLYNPTLTNAFVSKRDGIEARAKLSSSLFQKDYKNNVVGDKDKMEKIEYWNSLREKSFNSYSEKASKYQWNTKDNPIVSLVHGTDFNKATCIAMTGFASLNLSDAGYYGKGIYFTSSAFYSIPYLFKSAEPAIVISWVIPGTIYPVIESPGVGSNITPSITGHSFYSSPLKSGFTSHYVEVSLDGYPSHMINNCINVYDEIVVVQENQILPAFILTINQSDLDQPYRIFRNEIEVISSQNANNNNIEKLSDNSYLNALLDLRYNPRIHGLEKKEIELENSDKTLRITHDQDSLSIDFRFKDNSDETDLVDLKQFV